MSLPPAHLPAAQVYLQDILQQPANRTGDVAKQVLQTLSIIIQNVRSETGIFFLFSNNHVNNIVGAGFDFEDEEVLGYYISFLKAISLKLTPRTVHFFLLKGPAAGTAAAATATPATLATPAAPPSPLGPPPAASGTAAGAAAAGTAAGAAGAAAAGAAGAGAAAGASPRPPTVSAPMQFPLYSEAVKFAHHKEGMVRAGVRTLTLNVFSVPDTSIQAFVSTTSAAVYFQDVAEYMARQFEVGVLGRGHAVWPF